MKTMTACALALFLTSVGMMAGCSQSGTTNAANGNSGGAGITAANANQKNAPAAPANETASTASTSAAGSPVDFTFLGIAADKQHIAYKIKVNTDKPITQVDLALKETDDTGKVLMDTTLLWQNIVHSTRQPIEKGKTYDVEDYLYPGTTKTECRLKRVVFQDGTSWSAG
jgi:hypothetical protein